MKPAAARPDTTVDGTLDWLQSRPSTAVLDDMGPRYSIHTDKAFGVPMALMKQLAKQIGTDHPLALALWKTGWYEARTVAALIADPAATTAEQMDHWCDTFDNWAICDTTCFNLFDRTAHAWTKVDRWADSRAEYAKRAAFALLWSLALHDRTAVWRILHNDAIRPWFHRSWIFPRDPNFAVKAAVALDLYAGVFDGKPLEDDEFVVCADEKTSIGFGEVCGVIRRGVVVAPANSVVTRNITTPSGSQVLVCPTASSLKR